MKKFSFLLVMLLVAATVTVVFLACKKENAASTEVAGANGSSSETTLVGTAGSGDVIGLISRDHADEMAAEFAKKYPSEKTLAVGYAAKDLIAYLNMLVKKYNSDTVYVTFGAYDKNTAPFRAAIGRTTMFFMGSNKKTATGNVRNQSTDDDTNGSNYLNGGALVPPAP